MAWLLDFNRRLGRGVVAEQVWKCAAVLGVVTAVTQVTLANIYPNIGDQVAYRSQGGLTELGAIWRSGLDTPLPRKTNSELTEPNDHLAASARYRHDRSWPLM